MLTANEERWKAAYPALAETIRKRGDLSLAIRTEIAPDLSDADFEAGAHAVARYLRRLATAEHGRDLIYEEYFLALSLAKQARVINALAPRTIENVRGGIESHLRAIVPRFRKWLEDDLTRAHTPYLRLWPFPSLTRP